MPNVKYLKPPGKPLKFIEFNAPVLGGFQCDVPVSFILPPATEDPPN